MSTKKKISHKQARYYISDEADKLLKRGAELERRSPASLIEFLIVKHVPDIITKAPPPYDALAEVLGD